MNETSFRVFVVDDDPISRMILLDELQGFGYEIHEFENGQQCLDALPKNPALVLLDVEMPVLNGYETCQRIKSNHDTADTEVIFISSHDTTEEKLAGYDAGGSDYIIKPIQPEELKQKISVAHKNIEIKKAKSNEVQSAMQTAMTAITNAGEQGVVLDFMRKSFLLTDIDALGRLIVESFKGFGCETTVQMKTQAEVKCFSSKEPVSPLEMELLARLKKSGRIQEHGMRLIANFGEISLLIKNMPEDADKRGRLRDHLALLLEGAEARLKSLEMELGLSAVVSDAKHSLSKIKEMQQKQKGTALEIMDQTMADLEETFMSCGLTEDQEKILLAIVQQGVNQSLDNFEKGLIIDEELAKIVTSLESFS